MRNLSKNTVKRISKIADAAIREDCQSLPSWIIQLNLTATVRNANNLRLKRKAQYKSNTIYIHK